MVPHTSVTGQQHCADWENLRTQLKSRATLRTSENETEIIIKVVTQTQETTHQVKLQNALHQHTHRPQPTILKFKPVIYFAASCSKLVHFCGYVCGYMSPHSNFISWWTNFSTDSFFSHASTVFAVFASRSSQFKAFLRMRNSALITWMGGLACLWKLSCVSNLHTGTKPQRWICCAPWGKGTYLSCTCKQ